MEDISWHFMSLGFTMIAVVGGGGLWLGRLQNRVQSGEDKYTRFEQQLNGHMKEFKDVAVKVGKIETTCANILERLDSSR